MKARRIPHWHTERFQVNSSYLFAQAVPEQYEAKILAHRARIAEEERILLDWGIYTKIRDGVPVTVCNAVLKYGMRLSPNHRRGYCVICAKFKYRKSFVRPGCRSGHTNYCNVCIRTITPRDRHKFKRS